jgi:polysaccharide export outer membrane protein
MKLAMKPLTRCVLVLAFLTGAGPVLQGCGPKYPSPPEATGQMRYSNKYRIGPGDALEIFVWRYPEVSTTATVRPDGFITARLLEDVPAAGKTPTELARDLERELAVYLRDPLVSVVVAGFNGIYPEQIRVVGEIDEPKALQYLDGMTLLDVMIQVGGLTEYADGNDTVLVRVEKGEQNQYSLRVEDLIVEGDVSANIDMRPGDIVIVPESWF